MVDEYDLNPHVWNVQRNSSKCGSGAHYEEFQETNLVLDHNSFSLVLFFITQRLTVDPWPHFCKTRT